MKTRYSYIISAFMLCFLYGTGYAATVDVSIMNNQFQPDPVTIHIGDTVRWKNKDPGHHTSTSGSSCAPDGIWASPNLTANEAFSFVFTAAGTFPYYCIYHCALDMTGTVIVQEGGSPATTCPLGVYLVDQTDIRILRAVRTALVQTPCGRILASLYYKNAGEIGSILDCNPDLQEWLIGLVHENRVLMFHFIESGSVILPEDKLTKMLSLLDDIKAYARPQLAGDIAWVTQALKTECLKNSISVQQ